jgi:DNA-binding CsgD family transcriptional regulator
MRFVGRAVDLGTLAAHARAVTEDQRLRVVLIGADPGLGATRLLEEFGRRTPGMRFVRAAPSRAAGAPPLFAWRRVLAELAPGADTELSDVWQAETVVARAFGSEPLIVALDDLHRADEPTLTLLAEYADRPPSTPTLVVAVLRPDAAQALPTGPAAYRLWLSGLDRDEVAEVLADLVAWPVPSALAAQLARRTDGSPSLLTAIVGQLREADDGRRRVALRWPSSATEPVQRKLSGVAEETRSVLGVAAVVGREFDLSIVEAVVGPPGLPAIDEAIGAGLLRTITDGVLSFDSAMTRETCYDALGLTEAAALHELVADALLTVGARAGVRAPTVAEIAHHLVASTVLGGPDRLDRAVAAVVAAARTADRPEEAAESFATAVELASRAQWSPGQLGRLLVAFGAAQLQSGAAAAARESFAAAVRLGRQSGDEGLLAEAALAYGPRRGSGVTAEPTDPERASALTEALALLNGRAGADLSTVSRLRARLALESTGRVAQHLAEQALAAAVDCADPRAMAEALLAQPNPDVDQLRQAVREATALGDATLRSRAHRALAASLLSTGELGAADRHLAEVPDDVAADVHRLLLAGRYRAATERLPALPSGSEGLAALVGIRLLDGDPAGLAGALADARAPWTPAVSAWIARAQGRDDLADALIADFAGDRLDPWTIAILTAAQPGAEAARQLSAQLFPLAREDREAIPAGRANSAAYPWIVAGPATASAGPTALIGARLCVAAGELKAAAGLLAAAGKVVGQTPWVAWLRFARAGWLAQRNATGDGPAANQELKAARAYAADRGLTGLLGLIDRFVPPDGRTLTRREQEVLDLAAGGASAKEIAERLVIGERTVETHLANIYRKLGVRSRVELVAYLRDSREAV